MFGRLFGQRAGAIAAALVVVAIAFASGSHAQFAPKDQRGAKKGPPPKGVVQQPLRKGPMMGPGAGPNRFGTGPRGPMAGPQGAPPGPQGAQAGPQAGPQGAPGPNAPGLRGGFNPGAGNPRFGNVQPGNRGPGKPPGQFGNRGRGAQPGQQLGNRGPGNQGGQFGNRGFNNQPGNRFGNQFGNRAFGNNQFRPRGFTNRDPRFRVVNGATAQIRMTQRFTHLNEMFAWRSRMPRYPLPGEQNFTGVPPAGETRFAAAEMVCQWGPDITPQRIEEIARQHDLTILAVYRSGLTGGTLVHFAINGNRTTATVVRALEAERIVSQPNYVYVLGQTANAPPAADQNTGDAQTYVANKLRLEEVHKIATGKGVTIAVIDSQIDSAHPEIAKNIGERYDAVGKPDQPHSHGTGMAGAIVSQSKLTGIAPGASALAVHAFSTGGPQQSPQATTRQIIAGIDWALGKGARIINMSFAGPHDPMLSLALKNAATKGAILIAAVGNAGPKSPPLYPAADPNVIGVTAIDENDKLYKNSNVGAQVAIAAPGVEVMVPAPADSYQITTGTSVAAAHVSGVAALLLERHPQADAQLILEVLTSSATRLGANKRDEKFGWGLIDPIAALKELDARVADPKVASTKPTAPAAQAAVPARAPTPAPTPTPASAPAAAASKPALPRPGLYLPKQ